MLREQTNYIFCSSNPVNMPCLGWKSNVLLVRYMIPTALHCRIRNLLFLCYSARKEQNCHARPWKTILGYQGPGCIIKVICFSYKWSGKKRATKDSICIIQAPLMHSCELSAITNACRQPAFEYYMNAHVQIIKTEVNVHWNSIMASCRRHSSKHTGFIKLWWNKPTTSKHGRKFPKHYPPWEGSIHKRRKIRAQKKEHPKLYHELKK